MRQASSVAGRSVRPKLALLLPSGVVDVPDASAETILETDHAIRQEHTKWARSMGGAGRMILIDCAVVDSILSRWPELDPDGSSGDA